MQIEAGKYYKARDGRKVGPMIECVKKWDDGITEWWSDIGGAYYDDGMHYSNGDNDIIAEWIDDPTAPDLATLAARHGIKITAQVGDLLVEYDGRV